MSMIGNLLRVTTTELGAFLKDSALLEARIYNDESGAFDERLVDIDKTWDGIIFLLTGEGSATSNHPLTKVLFSGQMIDENQDLGYGPAHYLTPEQVTAVHEQIAGITAADLKPHYNPAKMTETEVYPFIWEEGDEAFEYIFDGFSSMQNAYAEASRNGEAMITFIN